MRKKLLAYFLPLAIIPVAAAITLSFFLIKSVLLRQALFNLDTLAVVQKNRIDALVRNQMRSLEQAAEQVDLSEAMPAAAVTEQNLSRLNRLLGSLQGAFEGAISLSATTPKGLVIASTDPRLTGKNIFLNTIDEPARDTDPVENTRSANISVPLRDRNGAERGRLVMQVQAQPLISAMSLISAVGRTGETTLAKRTRRGDILILTPPRFEDRAAAALTNTRSDAPIRDVFTRERLLLETATDYRGERVISAAYHIPSIDWALQVKMDHAEALDPLWEMWGETALLLLLIGGLLIFLAAAFIRRISRPFAALAEASAKITAGDLQTRVEIPSNLKEIQAAGEALNRLAGELLRAGKTFEDARRRLETDFAHTRAELDREVETLASIFHSAPDGVIVTNEMGKFVMVNAALEQILGARMDGVSVSEWLGRNTCFLPDKATLFPPEQFPLVRALRGELVEDVSVFCRTPYRPMGAWITVSAQPWRNEQGNIRGVIATLRDVTSRLEQEEKNAQLAALVESAEDAVIGETADGVITRWNAGAQRLFGYAAEQIVGRSSILLVPPEHLHEFPEFLARLRKAEPVRQPQTVRMKSDGTHVYVSLTMSPVKDKTGAVSGSCVVLREIVKPAEAPALPPLPHAEVETIPEPLAPQVDREQLELLSSIAGQDLQDPLLRILRFTDMLSGKFSNEDESGREYLSRIQGAAQRMRRLIDDLQKLSRIAIKEELFEQVDLNAVVKDTLTELNEPLTQLKARVVVERLPNISGNREQMRDVFFQIISNALKFRKPDSVPYIRVRSRDLNEEKVEIAIKDDGIGFEERFCNRIFRPFERIHRNGDDDSTGIGLAICEKIVSHHGGKIIAHSKLGKGSTFIFVLPKSHDSRRLAESQTTQART